MDMANSLNKKVEQTFNASHKIAMGGGKRDSNIELLRIVSMMLVILLHSNYYSLGNEATFEIQSLEGIVRIFLEQACVVCVNVFILISGWFGIRPKFKSLLALLYQVSFISVLSISAMYILHQDIPFTAYYSFFFGVSYWFVPAYLILYMLAPILNRYIENVNDRQLICTTVIFLITEFIFGWYSDFGGYNKGYSGLSFTGLYLLGRTINRCHLKVLRFKPYVDILLYLIFTSIPVLAVVVVGYANKFTECQLFYSSPFVILASLYFFLAFTKIQFNSRVVNWISSSVFAAYLIHLHPAITLHFVKMMKSAHDYFDLYAYLFFSICIAVAIIVIAVLIDKIRIYTWSLLCKLKFHKIYDLDFLN